MEKKMNLYPYIGKSLQGNNYLIASGNSIYSFVSKSWMMDADGFAPMENITSKYLANTYGEVESTEHAEFIIELCKVGGIDFVASKKGISKFKYFRINESYLGFYTEPRNAKSHDIKQITIPLPPKADKQESSEWPQIGDEVTWGEREIIGILKCVDNGCAWILCPSGKHTQQGVKYLKPPKTPEEELRDEFKSDFMRLVQTHSITELYEELQSKYDIKKKPQ